MIMGRPPLGREPLVEAICCLPRAGQDLRHVSARKLVRYLKCDRETIGVMLADLEEAGRIRRRRSRVGWGCWSRSRTRNIGWSRAADSGCRQVRLVSPSLA